MSDIGTITEIEPEDGLGWIERPNGDRVRFGGTACKGFVPAVGVRVEIIGAKPGYGGVMKATELRRASGDAAPPAAAVPGAPHSLGVKPSGVTPSPVVAPPVAPLPRTYLHTLQQSGARADDLLMRLLGRADVDDALFADLEASFFELQPQPGPALGCDNPWFYVIAMNGGGDAYGVYVHPIFDAQPAPPWLYWDHELDTLRFVAEDTGALLRGVVATAEARGGDPAVVARLRGVFANLGAGEGPGRVIDAGEKAGWLPPDRGELRPLDEYLAETDGAEMERGLLAHAFVGRDAHALAALRSIYQAWGWTLPAWVG